MKASDLQIGDWYEWHPDAIPSERYYEKVTAKTFGFPKRCFDAMNPISLTAEILEKNGWQKAIGENPVEVWSIGRGTYLHNTDNGYKLREGAEFNVPNIKYVHTLQHCLRLCGLNDLAEHLIIN